VNDMELEFVAGNFIYGDLPPEKDYLKHYFKGRAERVFASYYANFSRLYTDGQFKTFYTNFTDHTGVCCSTRWIRKLLARIKKIETALSEADKNFNLSLVGEIKSGKYSF